MSDCGECKQYENQIEDMSKLLSGARKSKRDAEQKLAAARAVLAEHGETLSDLRQNIDSITHMNTSADPKKLRLLLALADAVEAGQ